MLAFNPSTLSDQLAATDSLTLMSVFLIVLAVEITLRSEYIYPDNYISRTSPTFNPSGELFGDVPDNACQRSIDESEASKSKLEFDFIVVGSGAAGAVVANRLSKNGTFSVLVIEAGQKPPLEHIPLFFFPFVFTYPGAIWPYHAEVNELASNAFKGGCPMQYGKTLGGTTSINAMLWVCGQDIDFNGWSEAGAVGWSYNDLKPYFFKIENNQDPSLSYRNRNGYLKISATKKLNSFINTIFAGWAELKYRELKDYNFGEMYNGYVMLQTSSSNGERQNSYLGYSRPVIDRKNLFFAYDALATKVTFDGTTATGVIVQTGIDSCKNIHFKARKEVILSAGAFGSAKILLQSGVGPEDHLGNFNIPLIKNLPVGKNFQDHATGVIWIKLNKKAVPDSVCATLLSAARYLIYRGGSFSVLGTSAATAFIDPDDTAATHSKLELIPFILAKDQQYGDVLLTNLGMKEEYIQQLLNINKDYELLMIFVTVLRPLSTGKVELRGADPSFSLNITSGYFTDLADYDRTMMIKGFMKVKQLLKTQAWENAGADAEFVQFDLPLCRGIDFATEEYWKCYTKYFTQSEWHFTGTTRMGPANDNNTVVDPRLRVHGLNNLRVVDAGIMPRVASGNTQCVAYVIGEKGSALILEDHNII